MTKARAKIRFKAVGQGGSGNQLATSVTQNGATFTFSQARPVKQYLDGSWQVQGPVTITSITPAYTTVSGTFVGGVPYSTYGGSANREINGTMINPGNASYAVGGLVANNSAGSSQGFDGAKGSSVPLAYDAALNVDPAKTGSSLVFTEGQEASVVKAIYNPTIATTGRAAINDLVILTVVSQLAPDNSFRPGMSSTSKVSHWCEADLNYGVLPNLSPVSGGPSLATAATYVARPWQVFYTNNTNSRNMSPANSHPEYGQQQSSLLQAAALTLCLNASNSAKRDTLVGMVQLGIDVYERVLQGGVFEQRGAGTQGKKLPLVVAALTLNDPGMRAWIDKAQHNVFADDRALFTVSASDVGRSLIVETGRSHEPYTTPMIGMAEWGEQHSYQPNRDGSKWEPDTFYRLQWLPSMIGHALFYYLVPGAVAATNNPDFQAYFKRGWAYQSSAPTGAEGSNSISVFVHNMISTYGDQSGATPVKVSATGRADQVWITYSRPLHPRVIPAAARFTVTEAGSPKTISSTTIIGNAVVLTLSSPLATGSVVSLTYTVGANPIQDYNGFTAASLGSTAVTNITPTPVPAGAPVNSVAPAVTGTTTQGQVLSCSSGTWSNTPTSYNYQWARDGVNIDGSISQTRTLDAADVGAVMTCIVTASNAAGAGAPVSSAGTATVAAAGGPLPINTIPPVISGSGIYDEVHTVTSTGTWSNSPTGFTYQWQADGGNVSGATSSTYSPPSTLFGSILSCVVTASNANGSASASTNEIGPISGVDPIRRDTYQVTWFGSSSTEGDQDGLGDFESIMEAAIGGSQAATNLGAGGSTVTGVKAAISAASSGQKAGTTIIQYDTNSWYSSPELGKAEIQYADFVNNVVPMLNAGAVTGKRFQVWVGTEYSYGAARNARNKRFQRLAWSTYPGQVVNQLDYFEFATPDPDFVSVTSPNTGATDTTTIANGQIPVSKQGPDRSHQNINGYTYSSQLWQQPLVRAIEGGVPFYPYYPYYTTLSTAQTIGGNVCQLYGVGDLTGAELSVLTLAGQPHPDLAVDGSAMLKRASANVLKDQFYEYGLRIVKNGSARTMRQRISIGALTGVPQRKLVDGHTWGVLETNDNTGTALAPVFSSPRIWAGLGAGDVYEQSFVMDLEPGVDGVAMYPLWMPSGIQIQRTSSNALRVSNRDKSGVAHGQVTTASGGGVINVANGRCLVYYSIKVDGGAAFQQLIIDNGTDTIRHTAPVVAPSGLTVNVNPAATANAVVRFLAGPGDGFGANGIALPTVANNWQGKAGFMWLSTKAIDWSVAANRRLFRNSLADLINLGTASSGLRPGDGRSVIVQAGGLGYNAGATVTPYYYDKGGAADFGKNAGTGGDIEVFSRRDPTGANPMQGIARGV